MGTSLSSVPGFPCLGEGTRITPLEGPNLANENIRHLVKLVLKMNKESFLSMCNIGKAMGTQRLASSGLREGDGEGLLMDTGWEWMHRAEYTDH